MIFGLPGAALAMYQCAKPEKKKAAGGLSALRSTGLHGRPVSQSRCEFSFLFVAPALFVVHCVILAGSAYMMMHVC